LRILAFSHFRVFAKSGNCAVSIRCRRFCKRREEFRQIRDEGIDVRVRVRVTPEK
jgi:hypothetical protein